MEELFLKIVNMSISASYIALAVILLRLILKNAPKWIRGVLWGFVGIRLVCPFSLESALSLIPSKETISPDIITSPTPQIQSGIPLINNTLNPIISEALAPDVTASVNPMQVITAVGSYLWLAGIVAMLIYTAISFFRAKKQVAESVPLFPGIYLCDNVPTPFILGVIKPKIYIPSAVTDTDRQYVLAHEKAHLKRFDHIVKPLSFAILSVYWFNPIMWLSYILMCRDIELACDEKVIRDLGANSKKAYSTALVNSSVQSKRIAACPLAFGEVGVKKRIVSVLSYKKPRVIAVIVAVIVCIVVAVCFLTDSPTGPKLYNDRYYTELEFEGKTYRQAWDDEDFCRINGLDEAGYDNGRAYRAGFDNVECYTVRTNSFSPLDLIIRDEFCPIREADGTVKWGEVYGVGTYHQLYVDIEKFKTIYDDGYFDVDGDKVPERVIVYSEPQMGDCFVTVEVHKDSEIYSLTHGLLWFYHLGLSKVYYDNGDTEIMMHTDSAMHLDDENNKSHSYAISLVNGEIKLEKRDSDEDVEGIVYGDESLTDIPKGASDIEYYIYTDSYGTATIGLVPEEKSFIIFTADGNDIVGSYEDNNRGVLKLTVRDSEEVYVIFQKTDEGLEYQPVKSSCNIPYRYTYTGAHEYVPQGDIIFAYSGADDT